MKKNILLYMCVTKSLCYTAEINVVNQLYFNKIKNKTIEFPYCLEKPMDRGVWRAEVHGIT